MRALRRIPVVMAVLTVLTLGVAGSAAYRPTTVATSTTHVATLHSTMVGANEVPGPGDPNASGTAVVVLNANTGRVCYVIKVSGISSPLTAGHIHHGDAGEAGPVVIPFPLTGGPNNFAGCTTASKTLVQQIIDYPEDYYTNVHNAQFPSGVIRGQLTTFGPCQVWC